MTERPPSPAHASAPESNPLEAECKYRVDRLDETRLGLEQIAAQFVRQETHCDTYLRHPSRDFRSTDEALRIREIDGKPFVTYKGKRREGPIKIRPEIELPLVEGTVEDWLTIWSHLGFSIASQVKKTRDVYLLEFKSRPTHVTLDHVESLGYFVEIEQILHHADEIAIAQTDIQELAHQLKLTQVETRSYLGMLLASRGADAARES